MPRTPLVVLAKAKIKGFAQIYDKLMKFNRVQGNEESTFQRYATQFAKFCLHFGKFPDEVSEEEFIEYYNSLMEKNPSGGTMKLAVYGVHLYFRMRNITPPKNAIPVIKEPKRVPTYLSEDEMLILIYSGETRKDKIAFSCLYGWGLRAEELINLKVEDIHFESSMVCIRAGKGEKDRYIKTADMLNRTLKSYVEDTKPQTYLIEKEPGVPVTVGHLRYRLGKAIKKSENKKRIYLHLFRSSYAIHCILNGMNIYTLSKYMGHSSIVTTAGYLKALPDEIYGDVTLPFDKVFSKENRMRLSSKRIDLFIS